MKRIAVLFFLIIFSMSMIPMSFGDESNTTRQKTAVYSGQLNELVRQLDGLAMEGKLDELLAAAQEVLKGDEIMDRRMAYRVSFSLFRGFITYDRVADLTPALQEVAQKDPADPNAYKMLGQVHRLRGDIAKGIEMYEKVVELSPEDYTAYQQLGIFYSSHGLYEKAISAYKKALSTESSNEKVPLGHRTYMQLADVYIATGQQDKVISMYKEKLDIWPDDEESYTQLAAVYNQLGMEEDARIYALELRERAGDSAYLHTLSGNFHAAIGQQDEAIKDYEKAVELAPSRNYLEALKQAYEQAGKSELAAQVQERIKPSPSKPAGTGSVRGTVTDMDSLIIRKPLVNALVRVERNGQVLREATTDEAGDYEIVGLFPGTYIVSVSKTGLRTSVNYITITPGGETYHNANMSKEKPEPRAYRAMVLGDTWADDFAVLQIGSQGGMSIEGKTMTTLDDWQEFLTVNGLRIKTLIVKADEDAKLGVVIGAMRRAKRVEAILFRGGQMWFRISALREEPAPIIEVNLLPGQVTRMGSSIMIRLSGPETQEGKQLAYKYPPSESSIMQIANPRNSERFGAMELNDEAVDMTELPDRLQNVPAKWKGALIIQSEPGVRYEQIYQIAEIAKQTGIEYIGVGLAGLVSPTKRKITVPTAMPVRKKTVDSPAANKYNAGAGLVPFDSDIALKRANAPKAIPIFKEVIEEFPDTDYADLSYVHLGLCYEYLERWEDAEKAYGELIARYTDQNGNAISPSSQNVVQAVRFARDRKSKIAYRLH